MNPQVKEWWLYYLRNGGLKQCMSYLCRKVDGGLAYCPLGILCAIYNGVKSPNKNLWEKHEHTCIYFSFLRSSAKLEDRVLKWAGLSESTMREIIEMNDTKHYIFNKIADWIEDNL